jgi:hypothetical protein
MAREADLSRADVAHLIHPLTRHAAHAAAGPLVYVAGRGTEVELADGRIMFDGTSGLWCVNIGHGRARLGDVAKRQMKRLAFAPTFAGAASVPTIALAERLAELTPAGLVATMFTSGGSEANESAFKVAKARPSSYLTSALITGLGSELRQRPDWSITKLTLGPWGPDSTGFLPPIATGVRRTGLANTMSVRSTPGRGLPLESSNSAPRAWRP